MPKITDIVTGETYIITLDDNRVFTTKPTFNVAEQEWTLPGIPDDVSDLLDSVKVGKNFVKIVRALSPDEGRIVEEKITPNDGQTAFILSFMPDLREMLILCLNGVIYDTYTISGKTLTWSGITLSSANHKLTVMYYSL